MEVIITPRFKLWVILFVMFIASCLQCQMEVFGIFFIQVVRGQVCTPTKPPLKRRAEILFLSGLFIGFM